MTIEDYRAYCLSKKAVTEEFPFDTQTVVYKVGGKLFALTNVDTFESINLKCDPEEAIELRERYDCVLPGYHMNKKHWNTIRMDKSVSDQLIKKWIDQSYALVVEQLTQKIRIKFKI